MERRFPDGVDDEHRTQVEFEMGVILQMGFPSYFLVVADFIMWSKNNGVAVGPGRGSAAGSLVAYAMGITDLDPLKHGLIFERFLNPDRVSMPDIDIDFDERGRADAIRYVTEKWGADKVSMIATFGTIKAKAAIKDAGRVLGFPYALGDKISKAFPPAVMGKDIPLSGIFDDKHPRYGEAGELRKLYDEEVDVKQIMDLAQGLEGLIRQTGVHAAGVIMSAEPLTDHIPIMRRDSDGVIITQFDYPTCETLGLLKMDFLGLRNLTIMQDCLKAIKLNKDIELDLLKLPLDDRKTYELLGRGDTLGVFQLDGGGMRSLLRMMKPDNFEDISAVGALYRPGPMGANSHTNYALRKNGQQPITPIHKEFEESLAEILDTTYGLIVYQEQVMAIAQKVAGYTLGQADLLRRAMGKKKKSELDKQFANFEGGMKANGYSAEAIKTLWDILLPFSDYAFNKAHSAAYGLVSYWTAYLKANYAGRVHGGAADLGARRQGQERALPQRVPPHARRRCSPRTSTSPTPTSRPRATPRSCSASSAIRNVGGNVVEAIVNARREKGRFADFQDFLRKVPPQACNKRVVESLVKAGAFDELGHERKSLVHGARAGHRRDHRHQAQRGDRPGLPVRRRWRRGGRHHLRRGDPEGRVGQDHAPGVRAGDARPVRLRPSAARHRAHPVGQRRLLDRRAHRRRAPRRPDRDRRRPGVGPAAQGHQEGRLLGAHHPGGPRGRHRADDLPVGVPALLHAARRGRDPRRQGPPRQARGHPEADRDGGHPARPHDRRLRAAR